MISGVHVVIYSKDAETDRAFFRDVLGFKPVDAGHGWLIFALPPAEAAFHPGQENGAVAVAEVAEEPPQPLRAAHRAVGNDEDSGADPGAARGGGETLRRRQRMAAGVLDRQI